MHVKKCRETAPPPTQLSRPHVFTHISEAPVERQDPNTLETMQLQYRSEALSEQENLQLEIFLVQNIDIFATSMEDLKGSTLPPITIHTTSEQPIRQRAYRHSAEAKREIERQVDTMLKAGVIENSTSLLSSLVVLVRKKSGDIRFCVDFQK